MSGPRTGKPIGRPPLNGVPTTTRIAVALTPVQRLELQRFARDHGLTLTTVVRAAVNCFVHDSGEPRLFVKTR